MAAEEINAIPLDYFVGAKSTVDGEHILLKCRSASGEFHIAVQFDQVTPLISALMVEVEAKDSTAAMPTRKRKSTSGRRSNN